MKNFLNISKKLLLIALLSMTAHQTVFCMEQKTEKRGTKRTADDVEKQQQEASAVEEQVFDSNSLIHAIEDGNVDLVKAIINSGIDVNKSFNYLKDTKIIKFESIGIRPIFLALFSDNNELVKILLSAKTDLGLRCEEIKINVRLGFNPINSCFTIKDTTPLVAIAVLTDFKMFLDKSAPNQQVIEILKLLISNPKTSINQVEEALRITKEFSANNQTVQSMIQTTIQTMLDEKIANAKKLYMAKPLYQSTTSKRC